MSEACRASQGPPAGNPLAVSPEWLALREPADSAARSVDLVDILAAELLHEPPAGRPTVIHDLGCGTGSMGRWLAPRLAGAQHWILTDRDAELLAVAAAGLSLPGVAITVETRVRDVTGQARSDLAGASLLTASALLDMFTANELDRFAVSCAGAKCPVLVTLSVTGQVELTPADPLDRLITDAFNAHQRRTTHGRRLLGPDAVTKAVDTFTRLGLDVSVRSSPWRLGRGQTDLAVEWVAGWVGAAYAQQPELISRDPDYLGRRTAEAAAGELGVVVHHRDLLALPRVPRRSLR